MIEVDEGIFRPQFAAQLFSGDYFSGSFEQRGQYLKGLFLELYSLPGMAEFSGLEINFERAKADDRG